MQTRRETALEEIRSPTRQEVGSLSAVCLQLLAARQPSVFNCSLSLARLSPADERLCVCMVRSFGHQTVADLRIKRVSPVADLGDEDNDTDDDFVDPVNATTVRAWQRHSECTWSRAAGLFLAGRFLLGRCHRPDVAQVRMCACVPACVRAYVLRGGNMHACPGEYNGPRGLEPTRFGDWERNGKCVDF